MDFAEQWGKATLDAPTGSKREDFPPPNGLYEVALTEAKAFTSSAGNDVVVFEFKAFSPESHAGHEWSTVYVLGRTPTWMIKKECAEIGVDPEKELGSLADLDAELKPFIGRYYEVQVEHKGKYANSYIQRQLTNDVPESEVPVDTEGLEPATTNDDSDIPW